MSIRCYTGARLHEQAPDFKPPPGTPPPLKGLESALGREAYQRRCRACPGWTCNNGRICTRCILAGRGRA